MQGIRYVGNSLFPTMECDIILPNGAVHLLGASSFPFHLFNSLLYFVQACQKKGTLQSQAHVSTQCHRVLSPQRDLIYNVGGAVNTLTQTGTPCALVLLVNAARPSLQYGKG